MGNGITIGMSEIYKITFQEKTNLAIFSDSDSMTDYFHAVHLSIKDLLKDEYFKSKLSDVIQIHFENYEMQPKYYKRLNQLVKGLRYKLKTVKKTSEYGDYEEFYMYDGNKIKENEVIIN